MSDVKSWFWVKTDAEGVTMIDLGEVVELTSALQPGAMRHAPGGRTVQDPHTWRVTLTLRGGGQMAYTMSHDVYAALMARMGLEVKP